MHVLEAAVFANLVAEAQRRPAHDEPNSRRRVLRATVVTTLTGMFTFGVIVAALSLVAASPIEQPAVVAGDADGNG